MTTPSDQQPRRGSKDASPAPTVLTTDQPTRRRLADSQPTTTLGRLKSNFYYMRGRGAVEITIVYLAVLLAAIVYSLVNPGFPFLSETNIGGVLTQSIPVLAILSIGVGVLIIAGDFDLTIGAVIGLTAIVFIRLSNSMAWPLAFIITIAVGVAIHLINGLVVVLTKIPSFIATLGLGFFWTGASIFINGTTPAIFNPGVKTQTMVDVFAGDLGWIHSQVIWLLVIGAISWLFLHRHRFGNKIYAVGGNRAAAAAVSIKPNAVRLQAFAMLGVMTGIVGVLIAVRTGTMQPATTEDYTLLAFAAAVVGGCSVSGGRGTIIGMIVGAALIVTIQDLLILGQAPGFYVQLFVGVFIVAAATINNLMEGKAR